MALPVNGSTHLISALLLIYRPRKDETLSWPSWLTCRGWFTHHISGHPSELQVERRTGKVRQSETDVLPLCYATNWHSSRAYFNCVTTGTGVSVVLAFVPVVFCVLSNKLLTQTNVTNLAFAFDQ